MKKIILACVALLSTPTFAAATVTYTCPSYNEVIIRNYDGYQWEIATGLIKKSDRQVSRVKISTYIPLTNKKPEITEFDEISVSPGPDQFISCHYYGAPALVTPYNYNLGKNCRVMSQTTVECD